MNIVEIISVSIALAFGITVVFIILSIFSVVIKTAIKELFK